MSLIAPYLTDFRLIAPRAAEHFDPSGVDTLSCALICHRRAHIACTVSASQELTHLFPYPVVEVYKHDVTTRDMLGARLLPAIVLTMAHMAVLLLLVGIGITAALPVIILESTSDAALDSALRAALNVPELERLKAGADDQALWKSFVDAERRRLEEMMRGQGYRDAQIGLSVYSDDAPAKVVLTPKPGLRYRVGLVEVDGIGALAQTVRDDISRHMAIAAGEPASGEVLATLENEVLWRIRIASYPFVQVIDRELLPMPDRALASVRIVVNPGALAKFGAVSYNGLVRIEVHDLVPLQPFKQGDAYDPQMLDRFREALSVHPAIRAARVRLADGVDAKGQVQLNAEISEKQLRIGDAAGSYRTGLIAAASAIAVMAIRQAAIASLGSGRPRWSRWLNAITIMVLAVAFFLIAQRLAVLVAPV